MPAKIKITLRRSPIGYEQSQKDTVRSLGLKKLQQSVVQEDNPVVRGMINKVRHLVEVQPAEEKAEEAGNAKRNS
ncbi:MAG TPA: 50S ribosomal protein L30 [Chthonomonadaceae bacterium]|nr:50S ribosomal protein L30 [Chthonomonadaceae bacterium]